MPCSPTIDNLLETKADMDSSQALRADARPSHYHSGVITSPVRSSRLRPPTRRMIKFLDEASQAFEQPLQVPELLALSAQLLSQFKEKLQASDISMLPSFCHTLPSGQEKGSYLALDIGGTNLRIALIELCGRRSDGENGMRIVKMFTHRITAQVRDLQGRKFFAWLADRIEDAINNSEILKVHGNGTFAMGVAWSFPIEQTSVGSGRLLTMGKEFRAADGIIGEDLTELVMDACRTKNLNVRVDVIINDGSATLLSSAYNDANARFGLILGTGTNASMMLPCSAMHRSKFGERPDSWLAGAKEVLVNTEYSMFGKDALPATKWDQVLKCAHSQPDFQPYEQMISGRYLGELLRLVLVDAVQEAGLLGGILPIGLRTPYTVDTAVMAAIEGPQHDFRPLITHLALPPSDEALNHVHTLTAMISHRACALLAAAIHALWQLRVSSLEQEQQHQHQHYPPATTTQTAPPPPSSTSTTTISFSPSSPRPSTTAPMSFACNGSVIERYPGFLARTQSYVDKLVAASGAAPGSVILEIAIESALFGAAVAVSCLPDDEKGPKS